MSSSLSAGPKILPSTGVDFSAALGKLVKFTAGVPAVNDSATIPARGIILEGNIAARQSSIGILGALEFPVRVQIAADSPALSFCSLLMQKNDGTFTKDTGVGNRCICGIVTDPTGAVAGDIVTAVVFRPVFVAGSSVVAAPAAATSVDGAIAAVHSTAVAPVKADFDALLAEGEKVGDDAREALAKVTLIHTALVAAGLLTVA